MIDVNIGDVVTQAPAGFPMDLVVSGLTDDLITCGPRIFCRRTGAEVDEVIGWGPPPKHTGSYLSHVNGERFPVLAATNKVAETCGDNPELDGTPNAHPAWYRGHDCGIDGAVMRINDALDGGDNADGVIAHPALESLRRRCLRLRAAVLEVTPNKR